MRASLVALALIWAGCSFPSEGVPLAGDPPDADTSPDACAPVDELCDGVDNDCDGTPDEGFASNDPCDGPDADLCVDDVMVCGEDGGEVCAAGADNAELCNAADDDCDGTPDEGFALAVACDSDADLDECAEGQTVCSDDGTTTECNDATGTTVELCDGGTLDEDCDMEFDEGFENDVNNCGDCGNQCTNAHGTTTCGAGSCLPICNNGAAQCNGEPDDGCELQDTNPLCTSADAVPDITVNGDAAGTPVEFKGITEAVVRVRLVESNMGTGVPITGTLALVSGVGATYHLSVRCPDCDGGLLTDATDIIGVGRGDGSGDRTFDVIAIITYDGTVPSTTCAQWTLTVTGNTSSANRCGGS